MDNKYVNPTLDFILRYVADSETKQRWYLFFFYWAYQFLQGA
jgi:hypothetical protein